MKVLDFIHKIERKWTKIRLQPIRVFCFHQVSEQYDSKLYCKPDWMALSEFQLKIDALQREGYLFIRLQEAYEHIKKDKFRLKKYAVLTCDDGLKCQSELIPWLEKQRIPVTMFVTLKNLDGKTCGEQMVRYFKIASKEEECKLAEQVYLKAEELMCIVSPIVEIGIHGFEHVDSCQVEIKQFRHQVGICKEVLRRHKRYIPFFAYPFGRYNEETDAILKEENIVPVYIDGQSNYNGRKGIHREEL